MSTDGYPANAALNADPPGGVEGDAAGQNADPDLIADDDLEKGDA